MVKEYITRRYKGILQITIIIDVIFIVAIFIPFPGRESVILGSIAWILFVIRVLGQRASNLDLFYWHQARSDFAQWIRVCLDLIPYPVEERLIEELWHRISAEAEREPTSDQDISWNTSCKEFAIAILRYIEQDWSPNLMDLKEPVVMYLTLQIGMMYNRIIREESSLGTDTAFNGS